MAPTAPGTSPPALWMVEEFGRGGIARYAADVADLVRTAVEVRIATTTGGPAAGAPVPAEVWFARRGPAPLDRGAAALQGLAAAARRPRPGDLAWIPLGIRPTFERALAAALRRGGCRVIATVHNRRPHGGTRGAASVVRTARRCEAVVVHDGALLAWASELGLAVHRLPFPPPNEAPGGPASRHTRASLGLTDEDVVVALVGNLKPYKGVAELIAALGALPAASRVRAVLAGRSDDPSALRRLVAAGGAGQRVRLLEGFLPGGELVDVLDLADAVVLPYRAVDHSGAGALARSRGLTAVASDLPNLRELFGADARYVPPGDVPALAAALRALEAAPPPRRRAAPGTDERAGLDEAYRGFVAARLAGAG